MVGSRTNEEILELNSKIQALVKSKSVFYSDVFDCLKDSQGNFDKEYTYDGLHPNAKGYLVITNTIMPLIFE